MDAVTEVKVFPILAEREHEFRHEMDKAIRKAARYGSGSITYTIGELYAEKVKEVDWDGMARTVTYWRKDVTVTGEAAKVGNFEFLARVEFTEAGVMLDTKPGVTDLDPRFRTTTCMCEHCHKDRARGEVFVVRNLDTGAQVQIGRNCLRDYMGTDTPEKIANRFTFWREASAHESFGRDGGPVYSTLGALKLAARVIRLFGWCSVGQSRKDYSERLQPTAFYVELARKTREAVARWQEEWLPIWDRIHATMEPGAIHEEIDEPVAEATLAWVRNVMKVDSDYEHNLHTLLAHDSFPAKRQGLVISAVAAYHRAMDLELRRTKEREEAKKSEYVGKEGERLRDVEVTLSFAKLISSNEFGDLVLYKFTDAAGNIFVWFTGPGKVEMVKGEKAKVTGTVKRHEEREGVKQTVLTRCKVTPEAEVGRVAA